MVADGMGPFKESMCGRDWGKMIASPDIYALCSPKEQELQLTLSMMSDTPASTSHT